MPSLQRESQTLTYRLSVFFLLYFVQGIPYGLQVRFLPIFFRIHGMSLTNVSLYKLLLIPWVLKPFWAPFIDGLWTKKMWLQGSMLFLGFLCMGAALVPPTFAFHLAIIMFLFNLITSIQDIALDSLVIEELTSDQLAQGNIAQVVGYKSGSLFSGGVFAVLTEIVSWAGIFYGLAFIYFVGYVGCVMSISENDRPLSESEISLLRRQQHNSSSLPGMEDPNSVPHVPHPIQEPSSFSCYFWKIFKTDGTIWMLIFVIFYKVGEQGILNMYPMFLLDNNIGASTVGFWTGLAGQFFSIVGSIIGGMFVHQFKSLKFQMVVRGIASVTIWLSLLFWSRFYTLSYACGIISLQIVFLSGGAITTLTYTLIMQLTKKAPRQCRASHYTALATGDIMGRLLFSAAVGGLAQWTSYSFVFSIFGIMSILALSMMSLAPYAVQRL